MRQMIHPLPEKITTEAENEKWLAVIEPFFTGKLTSEELAYFDELFNKIHNFEEEFYRDVFSHEQEAEWTIN